MHPGKLKWILITIGIFGGALAALVLIFYWFQFGDLGLSRDSTHWGSFGDYVGGILGGSLAFLSLLALLFTIYIQSSELEATRNELSASSKAQAEAAQYSRLEAALRLREHYLTLMAQKGQLAKSLQGMKGGELAQESIANLDEKLREVTKVINNFHEVVARGNV